MRMIMIGSAEQGIFLGIKEASSSQVTKSGICEPKWHSSAPSPAPIPHHHLSQYIPFLSKFKAEMKPKQTQYDKVQVQMQIKASPWLPLPRVPMS